ncbi:predicted protein [Plenodomus lingam JN3]|uniref:Predicted protein n=1 Tax=Leptosphaeria maculans (strain JN3 / isolate v23.1.3 / race Av1-4-5-6-7-8) TaxID=985895 RepID=E5ACW4_LEPMJ|nr:predicted protein [Plenodomus lingam JN3]CBY02316.1 predicted protein [Plenodomus lingam JN3]
MQAWRAKTTIWPPGTSPSLHLAVSFVPARSTSPITFTVSAWTARQSSTRRIADPSSQSAVASRDQNALPLAKSGRRTQDVLHVPNAQVCRRFWIYDNHIIDRPCRLPLATVLHSSQKQSVQPQSHHEGLVVGRSQHEAPNSSTFSATQPCSDLHTAGWTLCYLQCMRTQELHMLNASRLAIALAEETAIVHDILTPWDGESMTDSTDSLDTSSRLTVHTSDSDTRSR